MLLTALCVVKETAYFGLLMWAVRLVCIKCASEAFQGATRAQEKGMVGIPKCKANRREDVRRGWIHRSPITFGWQQIDIDTVLPHTIRNCLFLEDFLFGLIQGFDCGERMGNYILRNFIFVSSNCGGLKANHIPNASKSCTKLSSCRMLGIRPLCLGSTTDHFHFTLIDWKPESKFRFFLLVTLRCRLSVCPVVCPWQDPPTPNFFSPKFFSGWSKVRHNATKHF